MRLPRIGGVLCELMHGVHDLGATRLTDVIEFADGRAVAHVEGVRWLVEMGVEMLLDLGRNSLDLGVVELGVVDVGVNESALGKFERAVAETFDGNADVVSRMALVLDVESEVKELGDGGGDGRVVGAEKNTVVNINNEYDIAAIKHTIIYQGWCETDLPQLFDEKSVPNSACLLLTVDVREQFQDVVLGVGALDFDALREFHKHIHFYGSLRVSHDEVDLAECPAKEETEHDEQANGEPRDDGSVRFIVVDAVLLFAAVKI